MLFVKVKAWLQVRKKLYVEVRWVSIASQEPLPRLLAYSPLLFKLGEVAVDADTTLDHFPTFVAATLRSR